MQNFTTEVLMRLIMTLHQLIAILMLLNKKAYFNFSYMLPHQLHQLNELLLIHNKEYRTKYINRQ